MIPIMIVVMCALYAILGVVFSLFLSVGMYWGLIIPILFALITIQPFAKIIKATVG